MYCSLRNAAKNQFNFNWKDEFSTDLGNVLPQSKYETCGFPTDTTAYPFLAAVGYNNSRGKIFYACDGVLINRLYVLVKLKFDLAINTRLIIQDDSVNCSKYEEFFFKRLSNVNCLFNIHIHTSRHVFIIIYIANKEVACFALLFRQVQAVTQRSVRFLRFFLEFKISTKKIAPHRTEHSAGRHRLM